MFCMILSDFPLIFCLFCCISDGKSCFSVRKSILTSKPHAEHPFAGWNTQQERERERERERVSEWKEEERYLFWAEQWHYSQIVIFTLSLSWNTPLIVFSLSLCLSLCPPLSLHFFSLASLFNLFYVFDFSVFLSISLYVPILSLFILSNPLCSFKI